jgi:hypothetical protein
MVEISKSGSGEGPGRVTASGYSTFFEVARRWPMVNSAVQFDS